MEKMRQEFELKKLELQAKLNQTTPNNNQSQCCNNPCPQNTPQYCNYNQPFAQPNYYQPPYVPNNMPYNAFPQTGYNPMPNNMYNQNGYNNYNCYPNNAGYYPNNNMPNPQINNIPNNFPNPQINNTPNGFPNPQINNNPNNFPNLSNSQPMNSFDQNQKPPQNLSNSAQINN